MSGKGKQADAKRKEEQHDLEQQFILRLPIGQSMALTHELESGGNLKDNLFIDLNAENRWGHVRYGGEVINAKLVDLPCIIETLKTTDNKTFYKTADISQMLICSNDMEPSDDESESPKKKKEKEKKHQHQHGIAPPLKNVRRRRFRKTLKKKPIDLASIEKEVKRLLRMDMEAIDVKWEEVADDTTTAAGDGDAGGAGPSAAADTHHVTSATAAAGTGGSGAMLDEQNLFGAISSSEDEADINIDEDSESEQVSVRPIQPAAAGGVSDADLQDSYAADDDDEDDDDKVIEKIGSLKQQLTAVEARISQQEMEIKEMHNPDLRRRFEAVLDELYAEKQDYNAEIQRLENM